MKKLTTWVIVLSLMLLSGKLMASEQKNSEERKNPGSSRKKAKISFKLSGGLSYLVNGSGDMEESRRGMEAFATDWGRKDNYSSAFDWKRLSMLPDLRVDLIVNITPNFGIGFGTGYITVSYRGNYSLNNYSGLSWWENSIYTEKETLEHIHDHKIRAIPLNIDLHFFLPMGKSEKISFFGHGGVGYYLGKITHDYGFNEDYTYNYEDSYIWEFDIDRTYSGESKCNSVGLHGGLGLEMKMSSVISLGVELFGRFVNFKNWEGDQTISWQSKDREFYQQSGWKEEIRNGSEEEHGSLWTFSIYDEEFSKDLTYVWFLEKKPSNSSLKNVRKSSVNLNTFGLSLSIRFHFDLFYFIGGKCARRLEMKKAITLFGKAAEIYFLARCSCKTFYKIEEDGQNSLNWQKSAEDVNPDKMRQFSDELNTVLITEYELNAKRSGYGI